MAYPWYLTSCTLLSIFVLSGILQQLSEWAQRHGDTLRSAQSFNIGIEMLPKCFMYLVAVVSLCLSFAGAYQIRISQSIIEEGNRKKIGLWLAGHAASRSDSVFLEPLGYIGFYSQLKMMDFPGLCSREVIYARKKLGSDRAAGLIRELKPDWLVLRAPETKIIMKNDPGLLTLSYEAAKIFDVSAALQSPKWLPGREGMMVDATYTVYRKKVIPER